MPHLGSTLLDSFKTGGSKLPRVLRVFGTGTQPVAVASRLRGILAAVTLSALTLSCSGSESQPIETRITGTWKITEFRHGAKTVTSDQDAAAYVGKTLSINAAAVEFMDLQLKQAIFEQRRAHALEHMQHMHRSDASILGITSDSVDIINISGQKDVMYDLLLIDANKLAYAIDGTFYIFEKQ